MAIGQPKYKVNDEVLIKVTLNEDLGMKTLYGRILIVDPYGVLENKSDVHYDVFVNEEELREAGTPMPGGCLFKHIIESAIIQP